MSWPLAATGAFTKPLNNHPCRNEQGWNQRLFHKVKQSFRSLAKKLNLRIINKTFSTCTRKFGRINQYSDAGLIQIQDVVTAVITKQATFVHVRVAQS